MIGQKLAKFALGAGVAVWLLWGLHNHGRQSGWDARDAQVKAVAAAAAEKTRVETASNVADAQARDTKLGASLASEQVVQTAIRARVSAHLQRQAVAAPVAPTEASHESPSALIGRAVLDDGTVRLLNAARTGDAAAAGAADAGDAEGAAPAFASPPVTGAEFVDNDLQVAEHYRDLAARHDELVDWVRAEVEKSRGDAR